MLSQHFLCPAVPCSQRPSSLTCLVTHSHPRLYAGIRGTFLATFREHLEEEGLGGYLRSKVKCQRVGWDPCFTGISRGGGTCGPHVSSKMAKNKDLPESSSAPIRVQ